MEQEQLDDLLSKGIEAVEKGYIHSAQVFLNQVAEHRNNQEVKSYLAYCLAKSQGRVQAAERTCIESIGREPRNPTHYLLLARIRLLADNKEKAILALRQGIKINGDPRIINEMNKLGLRRPAVIKNLKRNHPLNRFLGKLFVRLGLR